MLVNKLILQCCILFDFLQCLVVLLCALVQLLFGVHYRKRLTMCVDDILQVNPVEQGPRRHCDCVAQHGLFANWVLALAL